MFALFPNFSAYFQNLLQSTVKPVYNGRPWDPKKAAVV